MVVLDDAEVGRVLVISAHPDDVDFGAAGTVARWTDAGIEVVYCVVTDGDAGGSDPTLSRSELAALRRGEQKEAAHQVGVHDLRFLGYPDGRVEAILGLVAVKPALHELVGFPDFAVEGHHLPGQGSDHGGGQLLAGKYHRCGCRRLGPLRPNQMITLNMLRVLRAAGRLT